MKMNLIIIAAFLCACVSNVCAQGCNGMKGKKVYLIADAGGRLARCTGCGPGLYAESAAVHGKAGDKFAKWTLVEVGGKCALKADSGSYLARCEGCWRGGAYANSAFVHVPDTSGSWSRWTMEKHGNRYAFRADIGKYLARCEGCVPGGATPNFAFVHFDSPTGPALWKVQTV